MIRFLLKGFFLYCVLCLVALVAFAKPVKPCERPTGVQWVTLDKSRYPNIVRHIKLSWRRGYPKVLAIHRVGADYRRDRLLDGPNGLPTKRGFDRDEAPASVLRATIRADVMYVPSSENRSAGASLGNQISDWCDGVQVRYRFVP